MTMKLRDLEKLSDAEVEALYDDVARDTSAGLDYWRDEVERRRRSHLEMSNAKMARASFVVAVVSAIVSFVATGIAVVSLLVAQG